MVFALLILFFILINLLLLYPTIVDMGKLIAVNFMMTKLLSLIILISYFLKNPKILDLVLIYILASPIASISILIYRKQMYSNAH